MADERVWWDWEVVLESPRGDQRADMHGASDSPASSTVLSVKRGLLEELNQPGSQFRGWRCVEFRAEKRP